MAVWTNPATPVAATPITVAFWNTNGRDNLNWCRAMLGGADPTAANQVPVSSGTSGTTWGQVPTNAIADQAVTAQKISQTPGLRVQTVNLEDGNVTSAKITTTPGLRIVAANIEDASIPAGKLAPNAVTGQLGYTPVNRAGDSAITGGLGITVNPGTNQPLVGLTIQNASGGTSSAFIKLIAGSIACFVGPIQGTSSFAVLGADGATLVFMVDGNGHLQVGTFRVWDTGNQGPGSGLHADLLDTLEGAAYLARANHTGTQLASTISDLATAVGTMSANSANNANALGGIAAASYPQRASGTYSGTGATGRVITVGFTPSVVMIGFENTGAGIGGFGNIYNGLAAATAVLYNGSIVTAPRNGNTFTVNNGFQVDGSGINAWANVSGYSYRWVAFL